MWKASVMKVSVRKASTSRSRPGSLRSPRGLAGSWREFCHRTVGDNPLSGKHATPFDAPPEAQSWGLGLVAMKCGGFRRIKVDVEKGPRRRRISLPGPREPGGFRERAHDFKVLGSIFLGARGLLPRRRRRGPCSGREFMLVAGHSPQDRQPLSGPCKRRRPLSRIWRRTQSRGRSSGRTAAAAAAAPSPATPPSASRRRFRRTSPLRRHFNEPLGRSEARPIVRRKLPGASRRTPWRHAVDDTKASRPCKARSRIRGSSRRPPRAGR